MNHFVGKSLNFTSLQHIDTRNNSSSIWISFSNPCFAVSSHFIQKKLNLTVCYRAGNHGEMFLLHFPFYHHREPKDLRPRKSSF